MHYVSVHLTAIERTRGERVCANSERTYGDFAQTPEKKEAVIINCSEMRTKGTSRSSAGMSPRPHGSKQIESLQSCARSWVLSYDISLMPMTYLMSYVLHLIHLMYFSLMLGRVMLTCDSFALVVLGL